MEPVSPPPTASPAPPPASPPPPQNSNFMSPVKRQGIEFYRRLPQRAVIVGVVSLLLLFTLFIGAAAAVVYGDAQIPFLKDKRGTLNALFFKLPLIPKTPEMILIAAVESNAEIETYHPAFSMSADLGIGAIDSASIDVALEGPIDMTVPDGISFDLTGDVAINAEPLLKDELHGKIRKIGVNTYFKLDNIPETYVNLIRAFQSSSQNPDAGIPAEIQANLDELITFWIKQEPKLLDTEARKALTENDDEQSLIDGFKKNVYDFLLVDEVLPEIVRENDEDIEGVSTYHLSIKPSDEAMRTVVNNLYNADEVDKGDINKEFVDTIINGIDNLVIDIWIGKGDALIRKAALRGQLSLDDSSFLPIGGLQTAVPSLTDSSIGSNPLKLSLSTALVIKNINEEVVIEVPENAITMAEYGEKLQDALLTSAGREATTQKAQYDSDLQEISNAQVRYFVVNNQYPTTLNELITTGELQSTYTSKLNTYSYRLNSTRQAYIVFVEFSDPQDYYGNSQYYGITDRSTYPRALSASDFSLNR